MTDFRSFVFVFEVLVAEGMFLQMAPRRSKFWLRLLPCVAICLIAGLFFPLLHPENPVLLALWNFFHFFSLFALTVACASFCFKVRLTTLFALCAAGYATQHLAQRLSTILDYWIPLFDTVEPATLTIVLKALLYFVPVYVLIWFVFARPATKNKYVNYSDRRLNIISIGIVILCMVATRITDFRQGADGPVYAIALATYAVVCSFMALVIQFYFFGLMVKRRELETANALLSKQMEEFRVWKESTDFINAKCHDLKQNIGLLRGSFSEASIKQMEDAVSVYNNGVATGNRVLDVLLYEKGTYCENHGIEFAYMVDGSLLASFEDIDVYSLFGNIINNAIEGVERLEDPEKKAIQLTLTHHGDTIVIHEENYCRTDILWEGDVPATSKEDKQNHGYGIKSIKLVLARLGGEVVFNVERDIFSLNITIPMPKNENE